MKRYLFIILSQAIFILSCTTTDPEDKNDITWTKDQSADFNKNLALEEELAIRVFLANKSNWKTVKTGSGLRYFIYKTTNGKLASSEMEAKVKFKVNLLNGKLCYETGKDEVYSFLIDKSEVESGVQEGVKKMKIGEKAKLIIPSHLAHGLVGDRKEIPPLTTIVVDLELIDLK